jgi:hypothetical protein
MEAQKAHYGKYTFFLSIGIDKRTNSIDLKEYIEREEWEALSVEDQDTFLRELLEGWSYDYINIRYRPDLKLSDIED